jgi:ABC-2 type transport system permease protein
MGAALSGSVNDNRATRRDIPVAIVNQDEGDAGKAFTAALTADDVQGLLKPVIVSEVEAARVALNEGKVHALIQIPHDFSRRLHSPDSGDSGAENSAVQVYYSPEATSTAGIIGEALKQTALHLRAESLGKRLAAEQLAGRIREGDGGATKPESALAPEPAKERRIEVKFNSPAASQAQLNRNPFAFFAPSLAIFFLMISMFEAPRSILVEQEQGTLGRLVRTPTSPGKILLGKLGGSYLTGILQFAVLVIASRLIFNLSWGRSWAGLILMVLAVVVASASMGALIAAFSKTVIQASALGGGVALLSAGLGGNFFSVENLPHWLQLLSRLTINRWALEGFSNLTGRGLGLNDILLNAGVLFGIAAALFVLAFWKFQRRFAE